jgi:hypothetical protein
MPGIAPRAEAVGDVPPAPLAAAPDAARRERLEDAPDQDDPAPRLQIRVHVVGAGRGEEIGQLTEDKFLKEIEGTGAKVVRTNLTEEQEKQLKEAFGTRKHQK